MKSKKNKIDSVPIHSQIYAHAVKVKGLAYLLELQDVEFTFPEIQKEINIAMSMLLEEIAEGIRAAAIALERNEMKK